MKKTKIKKDLFYRIKEIGSENKVRGITLISLVVTIIILLILSGVVISGLTGENRLLDKVKEAKEVDEKETATESINLKITACQMQSYTEKQTLPTLEYLQTFLRGDGEIEYAEGVSRKQSDTNGTNTQLTSLFTKLKQYPYEFEINDKLQLASINGEEVETSSLNKKIEDLELRIQEIEDSINSNMVVLYQNPELSTLNSTTNDKTYPNSTGLKYTVNDDLKNYKKIEMIFHWCQYNSNNQNYYYPQFETVTWYPQTNSDLYFQKYSNYNNKGDFVQWQINANANSKDLTVYQWQAVGNNKGILLRTVIGYKK